MCISTGFSENPIAESAGWPEWRKNVQKHVSI